MALSPWITLVGTLPVLLCGEYLARRVRILARFNIPAPVVGGLLICLGVLISNLVAGESALIFLRSVDAPWWTWAVLPEPQWYEGKSIDVGRPFLVGFFACIGLNASVRLLADAGKQLLVLLGLVVAFIALQNLVGVSLAVLLGESPLLGLLCGSVALTGGHGTAIGFADLIAKAGYEEARVVGATSATFGLVAAGLLGGPIGSWLIRKRKLKAPIEDSGLFEAPSATAEATSDTGRRRRFRSPFLTEVAHFLAKPSQALIHLAVLLLTLKLGAWVSLGIQTAGATFPVYMGAMIVGIILRNAHDLGDQRWLDSGAVSQLAVLCLGVFLTGEMMALNLIELAHTAGPMAIILVLQVIVTATYTLTATFWLMGRDYEAAVIVAGHCGFGMGATPAAIANMESLIERYGPAPRALLLVPLVGAFLLDFPNALIITTLVNFLTPG